MALFKGKEDSQKHIHTELTDVVCFSSVGKYQACYTITVDCHHHERFWDFFPSHTILDRISLKVLIIFYYC
jgi:hypothetical protein